MQCPLSPFFPYVMDNKVDDSFLLNENAWWGGLMEEGGLDGERGIDGINKDHLGGNPLLSCL